MRPRDPADPPRGALPSWPDDGEAGDLRSSRRVGLRHACKLIMLRDGSTRTCELHDLSIDGLSFTSMRAVAPGTRLQVEFELSIDGQACAVRVTGRSSYSSFQGSEGFRIGVRFSDVDEASRHAIREFIERARGSGGGSTRPVPLDGPGS
jgi:hypothetical protein